MRPLCYLNTGKGNAASMIGAFAQGSGAEVTKDLAFQPGREAVFWGVDRATLPVWDKVIETRTPYVYVDNGYFASKWTGGDYYRITRNAEQCDGVGESDGKRWRELGISIKPWRRTGSHILIACQSDFWHERHGDGSALAFAHRVVKELERHTDRRVIVRAKPIAGNKEPPLGEHFRDCWAVVTHSSIVALQAILEGIPAFVLAPSAMVTVASRDVRLIETPHYADDRKRWASVLADNQWRLGEIRDGLAWRALNG